MTTKTVTTTQLREAPIDLRASVFGRMRKGLWWLRLITLISGDCILLFVAWTLAKYHTNAVVFPWHTPSSFSSLLITIAIQIGALAIQGNYQPGKKRYDYLNIIKTLTFAHGLILVVCFLYQPIVEITRSTLIWSWLLSTSFICAGRLVANITLEYLRQQQILGRSSVFIICDPEENEKFISFINKEKRYMIRGTASAKCLDRYRRQETLEKLNQLGVTEVFVAWNAIKNRMFLRWLFQASGITVHLLSMDLKPIYRNVEFNQIGGVTCLSLDCPIITGKDFWIKRSLDFCVAATFVLLTLPIYIIIAIAIKLDSPGPVFYRQTRIGLRGQPFKVWKFRTMRADAEKLQRELEALNETRDGIIFKIKSDPRITRVGAFLRRYSLDELPQLFNVLCGEMSLVGPRPLPTRDVDRFSEHHFIRHEVLPGITGLWQVSGRSNVVDFEQVIQLDLSYIENWSLWLDFEILLKTVKVVVTKEGAY
ncbi:MAG: sugar transferase [Mojavia pulchra JT2-VF2]|jgi:exopolysaccharide biosynthesis polyprenyl glycosylphosphotransferase|uniref:Sugar transferase n=1 Tax=Mojavia pulchra JT2-VF2 TaxID=287848 RepID=A0A951Q2Y7_9NOST|nr:sugar transferase [Mojavia pulchra JT2-VF2]